MKKVIFFIGLVVGLINSTLACSECGCGMSGLQMGLLPQYYNNYIGVRYHFKKFDTQHTSFGVTNLQHETFSGFDFMFRTKIMNRLRVQAIVPYNINQQQSINHQFYQSGIGDVIFMLNSNVFNNNRIDSKGNLYQHEIQLSLGAKLPTGSFEKRIDGELNPNIQLGSGSIDYLALISYRFRFENWISFIESSYKLNTENKLKYQFGNRFLANFRQHYWLNINNLNIIPSIGIQFEKMDKDIENDKLQNITGGYILKSLAGLDISYKRISFGSNIQLPIIQDIGNNKTSEKPQLNFQVLYNF